MKRLLVGAGTAVLGLALVTSNASAQSPWSIGAGAGGTVPVGNWSKTAVEGGIAYLNGTYRLDGGTGVVALRLDLSYGENAGRPFPPPPSGFNFPRTRQFLALGYVEFHAPHTGKFDLYAGGGGGYSRLTIVAARSGKTFGADKFALSGLLGIGFPIVGKLDIVGEGRWNTIFKGTFNPTTGAGTNLYEVAFTLGLRLHL